MTMKEYQYLIQPNIAQIRSNKRYIHYFSFGDHLIEEHSSSSSSSNLFSIKIAINVVKDIIRPSGPEQRFQTCYGSDRKDEIYLNVIRFGN
jgi:hypothetical protein